MYHFSHRVPGRLSRNALSLAPISFAEESERLNSGRVVWAQSPSCRFIGLYWLNHMVWFVASSVVIPHLKVKPLQFHCVLFGVEQRTWYSLLPDFTTNFLQATQRALKASSQMRSRQRNKQLLWSITSTNPELSAHHCISKSLYCHPTTQNPRCCSFPSVEWSTSQKLNFFIAGENAMDICISTATC